MNVKNMLMSVEHACMDQFKTIVNFIVYKFNCYPYVNKL